MAVMAGGMVAIPGLLLLLLLPILRRIALGRTGRVQRRLVRLLP